MPIKQATSTAESGEDSDAPPVAGLGEGASAANATPTSEIKAMRATTNIVDTPKVPLPKNAAAISARREEISHEETGTGR